jgi:ribonuclease Z
MAPTTQHYNWHVRALTVPGPDSDLSLFVSFDNVRYLFGCGEGTQRAFVQKRFSTRGLAGVFLPDGGSKGRAGLPGKWKIDFVCNSRRMLMGGMIMTVCDAGIKKLDVIGPPDTMQNIATLRASVYR